MSPDLGDLPEVARLTRDLIRIDTSNHGNDDARGEREAAEYVGDYLGQLGLEVDYFEPAPRRTTVCARVRGHDPALPALIVHGHLDVVPAIAEDWSVDPFAGAVSDGMVWGRGAVDMKNTDAMILASVGDILRSGDRPRRDVVVTFFADEEDGGRRGSAAVVAERASWFDGATEAIGEVGGYSVDVAGKRAYLIQVGEKAVLWLRLTARGSAGHASRVHDDNAVARLGASVGRLGETRWPVALTPATSGLVEGLQALIGGPSVSPDELIERTGGARSLLQSSLRTVSNPTVIEGGYKHNVIPATAHSLIDVRALPGTEDETLDEVRRIVGDDIEIEVVLEYPGMEAPFAGPLVTAMIDALGRHDPDAAVLPYLLGAGTDNKALASLGVVGYGFAPLQLPPDLDFAGMFHGVDERVPIDSLLFGQAVMTDLLRAY